MPENCPFDVTPYGQSSQIRNDAVVSVNYTNQDFWSMKTRLVEFLRERFGETGTVLPNTFNDLVESSIAIMLIENWAFLADTLSFKMDQMVNEIFIDTVTEADNAFRLAKQVGYRPTPPIPARSLWTATISSVYTNDVEIRAPMPVEVVNETIPLTIELFPADSNNNPIFDQDIVITAGSLVNSSIVGLEGRTVTDNYAGTGLSLQTYQTVTDTCIHDSVTVKVDGVLWDQVEYFSDSQPRREYRLEFDADYRAYIMFGNNRAGLSPSKGSQIEIKYRTGGGVRGNIITGYVETQRQATVFGLEFTVPVILRNYTRGEYGYDGDTVEDVRRKLPAWLRTQDRAVTGLDYKTLADQFVTPYHGQIGKSTAILRNYGCAGNVIDIYILTKDGTNGLIESSDELKVDLYEELEDKKMITDIICLKNGTVVTVDVSVEAVVPRIHRKFELEIRENIAKRVNSFFDLNNWDYGQDLKDTDIVKVLSDLRQIQSFEINYVTDDEDNSGATVTARFYEIIRPGDIQISFLYV